MIEIPADLLDEAKLHRDEMIHKVAEAASEAGDDHLMEKYVGGETPTVAEIKAGIRKATIAMKLFPVICGSAFKNKGVQPMLDAVVDYLPSPLDVPPTMANDPNDNGELVERPPKDDAPFSALVFKIMTDPFVGQLAFIRVYSGSHEDGRQRAQHAPRARASASAACSRCTRTSARRSRRSTPATSPRPWASRT